MMAQAARWEHIKANGGRFNRRQWERLKVKYGERCLCCGARDVPLTADHVIPLSKGGSNGIRNIQPLCLDCNVRKADTIADYREGTLTGCTA